MKHAALRGAMALLFLFACMGSGLAAGQTLTIETPETAARGDAFLALAVSDAPVQKFVFRWLGKTHEALAAPVSAEASPGQSGEKMPRRWQAVMLLPVPLEEKESALELTVSNGGNGADAVSATRKVAFYDKDRPVQKLSVDKKYVEPPAAEMARIKADREKVRQALAQQLAGRLWTLPLRRPVPGDVSSLYGLKRVFNGQPRGLHRGLDLRGAQGQAILACADGQVALTDNLYFSGNVVYINHGEGVFTAYLHMSEILVQNGEKVRRGQVLGKVGATGRVTGPHLHLSLIVQGESVDPQPFLAAQPAATGSNP